MGSIGSPIRNDPNSFQPKIVNLPIAVSTTSFFFRQEHTEAKELLQQHSSGLHKNYNSAANKEVILGIAPLYIFFKNIATKYNLQFKEL